MIKLPHHFNMRSYQRELFHAHFVEIKNRLIAVWHRRAGKSKAAINFLAAAACRRKGIYFHLFPQLNQARKVVWQGIDSDGFKYIEHIHPKLVKRVNNQEMLVELINGSIIQLISGDRYDAAMGSNPLGVVFDEFSLTNPLAWHYIEPILLENKGWALFIYTPRGRNHGFKLYDNATRNKDWHTQLLGIDKTYRADGSHIVSADDLDSIRQSGTPAELIEQEYYCSFEASLAGSYYGKLMKACKDEGRILKIEPKPEIYCYTFWDIGIGDAMVIWTMQYYNGMYHFIDYYENNGEGIRHYIDYLRGLQKQFNLKFRTHFAPHDAEQRDWVSGRTRLELARKEGINFHVVAKLLVADGIQSVREMLPRCKFDIDRCQHGINFLSEYHRKYNEITGQYDEKPCHDYASHCADGFRYFAVQWNDGMNHPEQIMRQQKELPYWPAA